LGYIFGLDDITGVWRWSILQQFIDRLLVLFLVTFGWFLSLEQRETYPKFDWEKKTHRAHFTNFFILFTSLTGYVVLNKLSSGVAESRSLTLKPNGHMGCPGRRSGEPTVNTSSPHEAIRYTSQVYNLLSLYMNPYGETEG
jgi:hypothetical protein